MNIEIQAVARFWIELGQDHVAILKKAAEWHYDGVCNQAAQVGGFIYGWVNVTTPYPGQVEVAKCCATFGELNLCLKILEGANSMAFPDTSDQALIAEMRKSFFAALRMANEKMGEIIFHVE